MSRPAPSTDSHDRRTVLFLCLGLTLLTLAVFGQTFRFEFVNYDDGVYVYENHTVIDGLTLKGIVSAFKLGESDNWVPLTTISHMLDCQIYGLNAGGHHLTNVLLHTASVILLFLVLWRMTGALWPSAFVAAVFAIHPLHVESVAWVAERKDTLSGLFFMLTLWAYIRYAQPQPAAETLANKTGATPKIRRSSFAYFWVLFFFACGLMAKPMLVTVPFVLLLLDYWPLKRFSDVESVHWLKKFPIPSRLILEKVPLVLLSIATCIPTILAEKAGIGSVKGFPLPLRTENSFVSYVVHIERMFYPAKLAIFYPYPDNGLPIWEVLGAFVVLTAISLGVFSGWRKRPYLLVGWLWYLGMLVPVIGFVQVGIQALADRYTYLPQIGLSLMVAYGMTGLLADWPSRRVLLGSLAGVLIAALTFFAHRQASYWKNSETLWAHAVAVTSNNALAHLNLGVALFKKGQVNEAITEYQKAMAIDPNDANSYYDLGNALIQKGQVDEAIRDYQKALALNPNDANPCLDLGSALIQKGKVDEAIAQFQKAVQIDPDSVATRNDLGSALLQKGEVDQALAQFQQAAQIDPQDATAHNNLGKALHQKGGVDQAILQFQQAVQIDPGYADARNNLGNALLEKGEVDEAIAQFQQVLKIDPGDELAHYNLGNALLKKGQLDEAIAQFQQAVQINPDDAPAQANLGVALLQEGKVEEALPHLQQALHLDPANVDAGNGLGSALLQQGKMEEAILHFQQTLKIDPANLGTLNNLGNAFLQQGKVEEAIVQFQQALQINPNSPVIHNNLGNAFLQKGALDQAIAQYQQAVEINPAYLKAHYSLGIAFYQEGKTNEAIIHFQKVLALAQAAGRPDIVGRMNAALKTLGAPTSPP